jgi:hypothetical protein
MNLKRSTDVKRKWRNLDDSVRENPDECYVLDLLDDLRPPVTFSLMDGFPPDAVISFLPNESACKTFVVIKNRRRE